MDFLKFKSAVAGQFAAMKDRPLFRTAVTGDELWATYLAAFPEGSNPVYRERTEHDCSSCKQFIRAIGNVVAVDPDGRLFSIWDVALDDMNYQAVADAMAQKVYSKPIESLFRHTERTAGVDKNFEEALEGVKTWNHFFAVIPDRHRSSSALIGSVLGEARANFDVLHRGLNEITDDALQTVTELIDQNSLYRGTEFKPLVVEFARAKTQLANVATHLRDNWIWLASVQLLQSVTRTRNSAIGTLLVDLSVGRELDAAVASFESKVAPANYKRPTALVTKVMINKAKETVEALGLVSALERRYATIDDITINNILFADRTAPKSLHSTVFDELADKATSEKSFGKVEEVSIGQFLADILPTAKAIDIVVGNEHTGNLVSLIAPVDPTAPGLFKWGNNFSWSYNGEFADSIKERVKAAGGNVTGELCCRLAWEYSDDLDFHMHEPNGSRIYFGNRRKNSPNGGQLDVDANGCDGVKAHPVENIFYAKLSTMKPGDYKLVVNNFSRRSAGVGFEVEIDILGTVHSFAYDKVLRSGENVTVAVLRKAADGTVSIVESLPSRAATKHVWNIDTQQLRRVSVIMRSPNCWDGKAIGNEHYFFMIDGCRHEGKARGFFNEFLKPELNEHRKVLEIVGAKMKTEESDRQLSGLGFSSTQRNSLLCRVQGAFTRNIKINF